MIGNRGETAFEISHLVFDDHIKAERFSACHWRVAARVRDRILRFGAGLDRIRHETWPKLTGCQHRNCVELKNILSTVSLPQLLFT
jgi:hypothetical protein